MEKNHLENTKTYLIGHMQYADGMPWRDEFKKATQHLKLTYFDPYEKSAYLDEWFIDESEERRKVCLAHMEQGNYDYVSNKFKQIRRHDLSLCDKSDFVVGKIIPNVASWGAAEELATSVKIKKPVFLIVEGGKKKTPLWIMGMIPHKFIYDSVEDVVRALDRLDAGIDSFDPAYWRLLKKHLR